MTSFMIVRWGDSESLYGPWHEAEEDTPEERAFVHDNGGVIVRAGINSEILADRIAARIDNREADRAMREDFEEQH